jgi:hypothetical protein
MTGFTARLHRVNPSDRLAQPTGRGVRMTGMDHGEEKAKQWERCKRFAIYLLPIRLDTLHIWGVVMLLIQIVVGVILYRIAT